jgi:hypothetical protein
MNSKGEQAKPARAHRNMRHNTTEHLTQKIIGTWKLVSWTYVDAEGNSFDFFGADSDGILMYDKHGYMNAQLM